MTEVQHQPQQGRLSRFFSKVKKYTYAKPVATHTVHVKNVKEVSEPSNAISHTDAAPAEHTSKKIGVRNADGTLLDGVSQNTLALLSKPSHSKLGDSHDKLVSLKDDKHVKVEYKVSNPTAWIAAYDKDPYAALDELEKIFQFKGQAKVDYINVELLDHITSPSVMKDRKLAARTAEVLRCLYPWDKPEEQANYLINLHAIDEAELASSKPGFKLVDRLEQLEEAAKPEAAPDNTPISPEQQQQLEKQQKKYTWASQGAFPNSPPYVGEHPGGIQEIQQKLNVIARAADTVVVKLLKQITRGFTSFFGRDKKTDPRLKDFGEFYSFFTPKPAVAKDNEWMSNAEFSFQRLRGVNPVFLKSIASDKINDAFDGKLDIKQINQQFNKKGDEWKALNYFIVDYRQTLDGLVVEIGSEDYIASKQAIKPQALFAVVDGEFSVICIRLNWVSSSKNPIFYANKSDDEPNLWLWVKTWFQNGEAQNHEIQSHLMLTHLIAEIFAVTTYRWIPESHVLYQLLTPHYEGTFFINDAARSTLLPKIIRNLMTCGYQGAYYLVNKTFYGSGDPSKPDDATRYHFENSYLKNDLKARGVDNKDSLPYYPFRDMGVPVWDEIQGFVTEVVKTQYPNDESVQQDDLIQQFFKKLGEEGHVHGIPTINSIASLANALTHIIWTCSAQHSVVNFRQYDYYGFVPNMPMCLFGVPPDATDMKQDNWDAFIAARLPGFELAFQQLRIVRILTTTTSKDSTLMAYETGLRKTHKDLVEKFRKTMQARSKIVDRINDAANSNEKYDELNPNEIPMSISI